MNDLYSIVVSEIVAKTTWDKIRIYHTRRKTKSKLTKQNKTKIKKYMHANKVPFAPLKKDSITKLNRNKIKIMKYWTQNKDKWGKKSMKKLAS